MYPNLMYQDSEEADLWLSRVAVDSLIAHLSMHRLQESVGVFIGAPGYAVGVIRLLNSTAGPGVFRIEASELARASRYAARQGQQIVALYHSHLSSNLKLSNKDRQGLVRSSWPWLIVALEENELQCCGYAAETCMPLRIITG